MLMRIRTVAMLSFAQILLLLFCTGISAAVSPELIAQTDAAIDTLRKRNCTLTLSTGAGGLFAGKEVRVEQTRNEFGFGGCITKKGFAFDSVAYGEAFARYFDWATPENEMKWTVTDEMDDYTDFSMGDYLVEWCLQRGIKVRGHNLFWNEDKKWLPTWTHELNPAQFKAAMAMRIDGAMTHYKGKVAHWDMINELIHYPQATHGTPEVTLLDSASGDPDIFKWVLSRARKIDSTAKFAINEYAIMEGLDATPATMGIFTDKMNRLLTDTSSYDVVGLEGHFGGVVDRASYLANLNTVSAAIPRKIWLTEVDFSIPVEERADKTEELMRTCFAYPNVGGIVLWVWWNGNRWLDQLTSVLVDSNFVETDMGERWRTLREGWKTSATGLGSAGSQYTFRGFHGEYKVYVTSNDSIYVGSFNLESGEGDKAVSVEVTYDPTPIKEPYLRSDARKEHMYINGQRVAIDRYVAGEPMYLYTYSVAGRQLSKEPFNLGQKSVVVTAKSAGCSLVRIGNDQKTLYTGRIMDIR